MARARKHQPEEQPIEDRGKKPWWAYPATPEIQAAHERAACLRARGHAAIQWDRTHGEIQTELDW
jgi:hypothetical protein